MKTKNWEDTTLEYDYSGVCLCKGNFRQNMEDRFAVKENFKNSPFTASYGIFDGHSGIHASEYASKRLLNEIKDFSFASITQAFHKIDNGFCKSHRK